MLTPLLTRCQRGRLRPVFLVLVLIDLVSRSGEHVGDPGSVTTDHMGIHPERDGRVSVPEPVGDDVHRDTGHQEQRCVDVPQIVKPSMRQRELWVSASSVVARFYRICVIDGTLEHSSAEYVRRPNGPAVSPTLG